MKKLSLLSILMMSISLNVSANDVQTSEKADIASQQSAKQVQQGDNKTLRLKFIGRRAYTSRVVKKEKSYGSDDAWTAATYVEKNESQARRLNRRFVGKKPYMNYQFD